MIAISHIRFIALFLFVTLCCTVFVNAQQKAHYSQYVLNNYIINPALSGIENYTDVKLSHRHQWVGLQDAPVTSYLTIHSPIGKKDYNTNVTTLFEVPGQNPRGKEYWDNYTSTPAHHGVGLQIINDRAALFNNFSVTGTYAYHVPVGNKTNLSAGIGVGARKLTLNTSKAYFDESNQQADPAVFGTGEVGETAIDLNAGLWLYSANYFIGVSALQLLPGNIDFADNPSRPGIGKNVPHFFATAGYRFLLTEDINALPSIMVKSVSPVPPQIDINLKLTYRDLLWLGANYRNQYGFSAMAGFNANSMFTLSYAYDYSTTVLNTVSGGTHEVMVGIVLGNKYADDTCPKNVW